LQHDLAEGVGKILRVGKRRRSGRAGHIHGFLDGVSQGGGIPRGKNKALRQVLEKIVGRADSITGNRPELIA